MRIIVYFAYLGDGATDYETFMGRLFYVEKQISWLYSCIDHNFKVVVVATCPDIYRDKVMDVINSYSFELFDSLNSTNNYEYHGLFCLKEISKNLNQDDFIFYCHSKGVINRSFVAESIFKMHTYLLLRDEIFKNLPSNIKKIGLFPSKYGWIWHNFF